MPAQSILQSFYQNSLNTAVPMLSCSVQCELNKKNDCTPARLTMRRSEFTAPVPIFSWEGLIKSILDKILGEFYTELLAGESTTGIFN